MLGANTDRREAIKAAFESAAPRFPEGYTLSQFEALVGASDCHPVTVDGECVGAVFATGPEIHACIKPQGFGRWLSKGVLSLVSSTIKRHGFAFTRAQTDAGRAFVLRLGFKESGSPGVFVKVSHGH